MSDFAFDSFAVFPSNQEAFDAVKCWSQGRPRTLLLVGPSGTGKTHLARAAVPLIARGGGAPRVTGAESHINAYIEALRNGVAHWRRECREDDSALVLEHLEDVARTIYCAEEVLALIADRHRSRKQTLVTATVTTNDDALERWLRDAAERCGAHLASMGEPRQEELADVAATLAVGQGGDVSWVRGCANVAEVVAASRRRALVATQGARSSSASRWQS
jgi:chromosomal replication initiation ATPase DnaA